MGGRLAGSGKVEHQRFWGWQANAEGRRQNEKSDLHKHLLSQRNCKLFI
jgi:hypothetical protein